MPSGTSSSKGSSHPIPNLSPNPSTGSLPVTSGASAVVSSNPSSSNLLTVPEIGSQNSAGKYVMKMSSLERSKLEKRYNVNALAEVLDMELSGHTYSEDPTLILNLFPTNILGVSDEDMLMTATMSFSSCPDIILEYIIAGHKRLGILNNTRQLGIVTRSGMVVSASAGGSQIGGGSSVASSSQRRAISASTSAKSSASGSRTSSTSADTRVGRGIVQGVQEPTQPSKDPTDETDLALWLNVLGELFHTHCKDRHRRVFDGDSSLLPMSSQSPENRKPDLLLLEKPKSNKSNTPWPLTRAVVEYTREDEFPTRLLIELPQRAAFILKESPTRRFVTIVAISKREFMVSVYHRSGVNHSVKYDLVNNLTIFYYVIANLIFADDKALGLDPNTVLDDVTSLPKTITFNHEVYVVTAVLFSAEGIQGRGTQCLAVIHLKTGRAYFLKSSWVELIEGMPTEVDMYKIMKLYKIEGVAVMLAYEDVVVGGNGLKDTTGRWKPHNATAYQERTHRRILLDGLGRPLTDFRSRKELLNGAVDILESLHSLKDRAKILHQDISLANMMLIDKYPNYKEYYKSSPASANSSESSTTSLPAKENLLGLSVNDAKPGNMPGKDDHDEPSISQLARGLLVDFDFASLLTKLLEKESHTFTQEHKDVLGRFLYNSRAQERLKMRTGTASYMAIEVLLGCDTEGTVFEHKLINDVESVAYALIKISIHYCGPGNRLRDMESKRKPIKKAFSGTRLTVTDYWALRKRNFADLGMTKSFTWSHMKDFVLPVIDPYFVKFGDMFEEINEALFPYGKMPKEDYNRRINSTADITQIINIVKKYRDMMPDDDEFVPDPVEERKRLRAQASASTVGQRRSPRLTNDSKTKVN